MKYEHKLLLDTGDVLNQMQYQNYDADFNLVIKIMHTMGYSAINLGPRDLHSWATFVKKSCNTRKIPIVSANVKSSKPVESCIKKYIIKEVNGIKIGITGVAPQENKVNRPDIRFQIEKPENALNRIIPELSSLTDIIILLSQLDMDETRRIVAMFPDIDLGLSSDTDLNDLDQFQHEKVMSIIKKGKQIGTVEIVKGESGLQIKNPQRLKLGDDVNSDPIVSSLISDHNLRIKQRDEKIKKKKEHAVIIKDQKKMLQMSPEEFIKQYNDGRK